MSTPEKANTMGHMKHEKDKTGRKTKEQVDQQEEEIVREMVGSSRNIAEIRRRMDIKEKTKCKKKEEGRNKDKAGTETLKGGAKPVITSESGADLITPKKLTPCQKTRQA